MTGDSSSAENAIDRAVVLPPLIGTIVYPGLLFLFTWAINDYYRSRSLLWALCTLVTMLLAMSIPLLAGRALILLRDDERPVLERGILYVMFAAPPLFTLLLSLMRLGGINQHIPAVWISTWLVVGLTVYVWKREAGLRSPATEVKWLRFVHGSAALALLCGFLVAHLINHDLAVWSVALHNTVMKSLRLWYRSDRVQPLLLALVMVLIGTGIPLVVRYSRRRMDGFRVVQAATGVYLGIYLCSHVFAVLNGRRMGMETDWSFAAGPTSLLDGTTLRDRLIPHYVFAAFFLSVHVACGLRVVLLQHGMTKLLGDRACYILAGVGLGATALITAALLGFHVRAGL